MDYLVISNLLVVAALFFMTCPNDSRGLSLGYWPRDENSYQHRTWRVLPVKRMDEQRRPVGRDSRALKDPPTAPDPNPGKIAFSGEKIPILDKYNSLTGELIEKVQTPSPGQKKNIIPVEEPSYSSRLEACNTVMSGLREACREIVKLEEENKRETNTNEQNLNDDPAILQLQLW